MKQLVIIGAGQFGRAAGSLLDPERLRVLAFGDNNAAAWDRESAPPVLSLADALALGPDAVMIAVKGEERYRRLEAQVRALGWTGEILDFCARIEGFSLRSAVLKRVARRIRAQAVPGAAAELGVYRGAFARQINEALPDRTLYLFDTFSGFPQESLSAEGGRSRAGAGDFSDADPAALLASLPHPERVEIRKGVFPATAEGLEERFCLVSLDADLYLPTLEGLRFFYPRLAPGGVMILHDYDSAQYGGVRAALEEFERQHGPVPLVPLCDPHGTAVLAKPFS